MIRPANTTPTKRYAISNFYQHIVTGTSDHILVPKKPDDDCLYVVKYPTEFDETILNNTALEQIALLPEVIFIENVKYLSYDYMEMGIKMEEFIRLSFEYMNPLTMSEIGAIFRDIRSISNTLENHGYWYRKDSPAGLRIVNKSGNVKVRLANPHYLTSKKDEADERKLTDYISGFITSNADQKLQYVSFNGKLNERQAELLLSVVNSGEENMVTSIRGGQSTKCLPRDQPHTLDQVKDALDKFDPKLDIK